MSTDNGFDLVASALVFEKFHISTQALHAKQTMKNEVDEVSQYITAGALNM